MQKSLFFSITTFLTAFLGKLTKYSGIWELDILKFSGHHMNKPNKPSKRKNTATASYVHEGFGLSQDSSIWVLEQSVMMRACAHTPIHFLFLIHI